MKLSAYRRQESPQGGGGFPRLPVRVPDIGRDIAAVGASLGQIADALQKSEDELQAAQGLGERTARVKDLGVTLQQDPTWRELAAQDPQRAANAFAAQAQQIESDILKGVTRRPAQQALQRHFALSLPEEIVNAKITATKIRAEGQLGRLEAMGTELSKQAVQATTERDRDEATTLHADLVARAEQRGLLTAVAAEKLRHAFRLSVDDGRAIRDLQDDPQGFRVRVQDPEEYASLPQERRLILSRQAHELENQRRAERDREERRIKEDLEERQKVTAATLRERAWNADSTVVQDIFRLGPAGTGEISEVEQRELLALSEARRKQGIRESDPETRRMVIADVTALTPSLRHSDLVRLNTQGLLSDDDLERYGNALTGRIKYDIAQVKAEEREARRDYDAEYRSAQEILRYQLRPRGILANVPMMRQRSQEIADRAAEELLAGTKLAGSKRPPMEVLNQVILPKYAPLLDAASSLTTENMRSLVQDTPTVDALKKARAAGRIGDDEYFSRLRILQQIETLETKARQATPQPSRTPEPPELGLVAP